MKDSNQNVWGAKTGRKKCCLAKMSPANVEPPCGPSAFTLLEVIAAVVVLFTAWSVILPSVMDSRMTARRSNCTNQLKQIGLAIHNYAQANRVFPPGTICADDPIQPSNQYDVWAEAAKTEPGHHGTSFLLRILPFLELDYAFKAWDFSHGVATNAERGVAMTEVKCFYCPSRRHALRPQDRVMMLSPSWTGGGTDYGGCAGRHAAFTDKTDYNLCDASMRYEPEFHPRDLAFTDTEKGRWGIFGRVNIGTTFNEITDGMSNTIMTGELQRLTGATPGSKDGWAIGGPATLFTTGAMMHFDGKTVTSQSSPNNPPASLLNNHFWGSPGSDHPGVCSFGIADGSVRLFNTEIDPNVFALLGSMADRSPTAIPD